ncbi:dynein regulatory complex protein 8 [Tupaia chinensis]|uniref:dynein regulatory complex protein 8 n=1 Tax=Tupaia chinensis TaxID=246437 RepID=UPI000704573C|nr:dynein regulatory complex protein 8 [Tupaia chinensis]
METYKGRVAFIQARARAPNRHRHSGSELRAPSAAAELHKKIREAFEVFDHESNNTVDVREIGTIIRSLGCCPSEGELHDLIAEVEEEEPTGYIRFEKFLPVMTEVLQEKRYRPIPEDVLLRAFEVLDPAKHGFLTKDELIKYMTEEGMKSCFQERRLLPKSLCHGHTQGTVEVYEEQLTALLEDGARREVEDTKKMGEASFQNNKRIGFREEQRTSLCSPHRWPLLHVRQLLSSPTCPNIQFKSQWHFPGKKNAWSLVEKACLSYDSWLLQSLPDLWKACAHHPELGKLHVAGPNKQAWESSDLTF